MTRHVRWEGSFFDEGVKKLAIALPARNEQRLLRDKAPLLVVFGSTFRLVGGGETECSLAPEVRFITFILWSTGTIMSSFCVMDCQLKAASPCMKREHELRLSD